MIAGCLLFVVARQQLLQSISPPNIEFYQIWLTGMVLIWPSKVIDQMIYINNMGKIDFRNFKNLFAETTRLIALIFCVALFSRWLPFLFKLCPWGQKLFRPRVYMFYIGRWLVCRECLWYLLIIVPCFFILGYMKKYCLKPLSLYRALLFDM